MNTSHDRGSDPQGPLNLQHSLISSFVCNKSVTPLAVPLSFPPELPPTPCKGRWKRCSLAPRRRSSWWPGRSRPRQPWWRCSSWTWWRAPWNRLRTERCRPGRARRPCWERDTTSESGEASVTKVRGQDWHTHVTSPDLSRLISESWTVGTCSSGLSGVTSPLSL